MYMHFGIELHTSHNFVNPAKAHTACGESTGSGKAHDNLDRVATCYHSCAATPWRSRTKDYEGYCFCFLFYKESAANTAFAIKIASVWLFDKSISKSKEPTWQGNQTIKPTYKSVLKI